MNDEKQTQKQDPSTKLILIIDDEESLIDYMISLLQKEGFRTKSAMDGKIGLKRVKEEKTDLILLDMMMPNASGFEVVKSLQAEEETRNTPVFIVTAKTGDRSTWDMIRQEPNVKEIIAKPINPFDFRKKIHTILNTVSPQDKKDLEAKMENKAEKNPKKGWELPPAFRNKKAD